MTIAIPEPQGAPDDGEVISLVSGWLAAQKSVHTRRAYARDLDPRIILLLPDLFGGPTEAAPPRPAAIPPWIDWCRAVGADPVDGITQTHVNAYARMMESAALSPATRARKLSAISSWYKWMCQEGRVPDIPTSHIKRPLVDLHTSKTPGLTRDQAQAMLKAADAAQTPQHLRNAALLAVLLVTTARVSDATGADIEDLGMDRGQQVLWVTRKGEKQQPLPLPPAAFTRLTAYLASRADMETAPAVRSRPGSPKPRRVLFATRKGERMDEPLVFRMIRSLAKAADLPPELISRLGPHAMRHTAITMALDAGVPLADVQDLAGHVDARTTQRYNHARGRLDRTAAAAFSIAAWLSDGDSARGDQ